MTPGSHPAFCDGQSYHLIDQRWLSSWRAYHEIPTCKKPEYLTNSALQCEHGKSIIPDEFAQIRYFKCPNSHQKTGTLGDGLPPAELITDQQWRALCRLYSPQVEEEEIAAEARNECALETTVIQAENSLSSIAASPAAGRGETEMQVQVEAPLDNGARAAAALGHIGLPSPTVQPGLGNRDDRDEQKEHALDARTLSKRLRKVRRIQQFDVCLRANAKGEWVWLPGICEACIEDRKRYAHKCSSTHSHEARV